MMRPKLRLGVIYDMRNTPPMRMSDADLYASVIEQVAWLDRLGLDLVWFTEHHFVEDGYLPSWVPVAAAMAARTQRIRFSCDVCLLPFNHPVRLAEDLAVLDAISNGRVEIGVGLGYAPHEFAGFGIPVSRRVSLTDEGIAILRRAFTGEAFSFHGKRYELDNVKIRPGYTQPGGPPLWVAAMGEAGAQRAARANANLLPQGPRGMVLDPWERALRADGRDPAKYRVGIIKSCLVTDDPDRDWPIVRECERYRAAVYQGFRVPGTGGGGVAGNKDEDRIPQTWVVGNVDQCVEKLSAFISEYGITDLVSWAVPPGLRPEWMAPSLEKFARDVAPRLRARFAGGGYAMLSHLRKAA